MSRSYRSCWPRSVFCQNCFHRSHRSHGTHKTYFPATRAAQKQPGFDSLDAGRPWRQAVVAGHGLPEAVQGAGGRQNPPRSSSAGAYGPRPPRSKPGAGHVVQHGLQVRGPGEAAAQGPVAGPVSAGVNVGQDQPPAGPEHPQELGRVRFLDVRFQAHSHTTMSRHPSPRAARQDRRAPRHGFPRRPHAGNRTQIQAKGQGPVACGASRGSPRSRSRRRARGFQQPGRQVQHAPGQGRPAGTQGAAQGSPDGSRGIHSLVLKKVLHFGDAAHGQLLENIHGPAFGANRPTPREKSCRGTSIPPCPSPEPGRTAHRSSSYPRADT